MQLLRNCERQVIIVEVVEVFEKLFKDIPISNPYLNSNLMFCYVDLQPESLFGIK